MKNLKFILYIIIVSILIFFSVEIFSRIIFPVSIGAMMVDKDKNLKNHHYNKKNSSYYLYHPEYFVLTNIDSEGNRVIPSSSETDKLLIFVGDSQMFGQGVDDFNTIPNLICKKIIIKCVNLAVPGTGTINQSKILEAYIKKNEYKYQNIRVIHLISASSMYNHSGNDLTDNLVEFDYLQKLAIIHTKKIEKNYPNINENKNKIPNLPEEIIDKPLDEIKQILDVKKIQQFEEEEFNYQITFEDIILNTLKFFYINTNIARVLGHFYGLDIRASIYSKYPNLVNEKQINILNNVIQLIRKDLSEKNIGYYPFLHSTYPEIKNSWNYKTYEKLEPMFEKLYMPEYEINQIDQLFFKGDGHNNVNGNKKISNFIIQILNSTKNEKNTY